jgi:transposase
LGWWEAQSVKQYSADLRERLLGAIDAGLSQAEAARLFGVGVSSIKRWRARQQQTGAVQALPRPGRTRRISRGAEAALVAQVRAAPDATLAEHCATWAAATGVVVSPSTMSRALSRAGWPLKKSR